MTRRRSALALCALSAWVALAWLARSDATWTGVDEAVVERFARDAGQAPAPTPGNARGDLLPLLFLIGGAAAGFVAGHSFRGLFSTDPDRSDHDPLA